jgi:8-oxo-dGTP diphosphatase
MELAPGIDYFCHGCTASTGLAGLFARHKDVLNIPMPSGAVVPHMAYPGVAIGVVIQHPTNGCILLGCRKGELGGGQYAIPGGKVDFAETPFATAMREIKEETNLDLKDIYFTGKVTNDYFPDRGKHYITLYYIAEAINPQDLKTLEPEKVEEWKWFDPSKELPQPMWMHTGMLLTSMLEYDKEAVHTAHTKWRFKTPDIDGKS